MNDVHREGEWLRNAWLWIALTALLFGVVTAILLTYLALFDTEPPFTTSAVATFDTNERPTDTFRAGDTMLMQRDLCFVRDVPITMSRKLVRVSPKPEVIVFLNHTSNQQPPECVNNMNTVHLPSYMLPGVYEYVTTLSWQNNPFQTASAVLPKPRITVVK